MKKIKCACEKIVYEGRVFEYTDRWEITNINTFFGIRELHRCKFWKHQRKVENDTKQSKQ